jgi:hypothetical protein
MDDDPGADFLAAEYRRQLQDIDLEIVREALLCGAPADRREVLIHILENDPSDCRERNPAAFARLRAAVTMHMEIRHKAEQDLGRAATQAIVDEIVAKLKQRVGGAWNSGL